MYTPSDQRDEHPPGDLALDLQLPQVVQIDGQRVGASGAKAEIGGEAAKYALPAELRLGQARDRDIGECDEASPQAPVTEPSVRTKPAGSAFAPPCKLRAHWLATRAQSGVVAGAAGLVAEAAGWPVFGGGSETCTRSALLSQRPCTTSSAGVLAIRTMLNPSGNSPSRSSRN